MAGTTVTTLAKKKMVKARAGISSLPKIVGMAFGDGGVDSGGTVKPHSADQNTLHHELLRKNVDGYEVLSDTKIRYRCTLAENELANTYISEVGLYICNRNLYFDSSVTSIWEENYSDMLVAFCRS